MTNEELWEKKRSIVALVKKFQETSQLKYTEIVQRMNEKLPEEYTRDKFENYWRRLPEPQKITEPRYQIDEVFALIEAFTDGVPTQQLISIYDVFSLLDLTGISTSLWSALRDIFSDSAYDGSINQWLLDHEVVIQHHPLETYIRDFDYYIKEKADGFVGRRWLFAQLDDFIEHNTQGFLVILGQPGIGKSAVAARLVYEREYIHHFNIRFDNVTRQSDLLGNLCAQLITQYNLAHTEFPHRYDQNNLFLMQLLHEVSLQVDDCGKPCVIVIDALDEAEPLVLPRTLPSGVFMILLSRPPYDLLFECESIKILLDPESENNQDDIFNYVLRQVQREKILDYVKRQDVTEADFADTLYYKSEGNFVYLHHIFFEIERGVYFARDLKDIPQGLRAYYEDQWVRIKGQNEMAWFQYKLPILLVLAVVYEPIPVDLIVEFSKVNILGAVKEVLYEWQAFLYEKTEQTFPGDTKIAYRLYHESFFDFLKAKEQIASERVSLVGVHQQITDTMWDGLGGDVAFGLDDNSSEETASNE